MGKSKDNSFLCKLTTLRNYVHGMGLSIPEKEMSLALRGNGYNVDIALERILERLASGDAIRSSRSQVHASGRSNGSMDVLEGPAKSRSSSGGGRSASSLGGGLHVASNKRSLAASPGKQSQAPTKRRKLNSPKKNVAPPGPARHTKRQSGGDIGHKETQSFQSPRSLLLCKRWTVACSKSARGRVRHGEIMTFQDNYPRQEHVPAAPTSQNQPKRATDPLVRFRSRSGLVEGSLNPQLCSFLAPLLRLVASNTLHHDRHVGRAPDATHMSSLPMIYLEGEALMEDRHIVIGTELPICLKIYFNDPLGFFQLFQTATGKTVNNANPANPANVCLTATRRDRWANLPPNPTHTERLAKRKECATLAQAAFRLLQWAQKGDACISQLRDISPSQSESPLSNESPSLSQPSQSIQSHHSPDANDSCETRHSQLSLKTHQSSDSLDVHQQPESPRMSHAPQTLQTPQTPQTSNQYQDTPNKVGHETNTIETLAENITNEYKDESIPSEVDLSEITNASNQTKLPECKDPTGLHVTLRPYQRQALYWMTQREKTAGNDTTGTTGTTGNTDKMELGSEYNDEMSLLAELAASFHGAGEDMSELSNAVVMDGSDMPNTDLGVEEASEASKKKHAITCDCGPVRVRGKAVPLAHAWREGEEENIRYVPHPLWKERYLTTEDMNEGFVFYVNELLGLASATPPNQSRRCTGGILADAMGLGKTVMLLSLIVKSKNDTDANVDTEEQSKCQQSEKDVVDLASDPDVNDVTMEESDDIQIQAESDKLVKGRKDVKQTKQQLTPTAPSDRLFACRKRNGTTLIVAPLSLVSQWEEEVASKTDLSQYVYYDLASKTSIRGAFSSVDVVVTTYGTIQSEYASLMRSNKVSVSTMVAGDRQPLLSFDWKRVILDEAHGIKNPSTQLSRGCCMLKAKSRWCVTGTPIQNSLQDVYGLLKFLRHEPWCEATFWRNAITDALLGTPSGSGNVNSIVKAEDGSNEGRRDDKEASTEAMSVAFGRVRRVLAPILLRRTKDTLGEDGTPILTLPPIQSSIVHVTLSPPEREFYNSLLQRSQSVFEGFLNAGTASKSWFAIFSLLQRLRQACDHVSLTVLQRLGDIKMENEEENEVLDVGSSKNGSDSAVNDNFLKDLLEKFKKNTNKNISYSDDKSETHNSSVSFVRKVAESLSQSVQSTDDRINQECPICLEEPLLEDAIHTPCAHMFCRKCLISEFTEQQRRSKKKTVALNMFKKIDTEKIDSGDCPLCHKKIKISHLIHIEKSNDGELVTKFVEQKEVERENAFRAAAIKRDAIARETLESALNGATSSKLEAVLKELDEVWKLDPRSKVLIFSQYLGFLDIIGSSLKKRGVNSFRIDGKMTLKERVAMIDNFNKEKASHSVTLPNGDLCERGSVFLVSMKAGGVGLNLVAASSVFIIDPWWNVAVEDQCVNRIHRIGQQAEVVRVRKFVVVDSVEEKIVNLQEKKKGMANEILSDAENAEIGASKPTLEDFKLLFGA